MRRRSFLKRAAAASALSSARLRSQDKPAREDAVAAPHGRYNPGRIPYEYSLFLSWLNGTPTAVFEKHVTHQGMIAYVTPMGEIARIPKRIGDLSKIRPRPTSTPHGVKFEREARYAGPDVPGDYILNSQEDPSY